MLLGCIADDFTGATDLAGMLVKSGMRTIQILNVPSSDPLDMDADAVVIALKSRTLPPAEAIAQSLDALAWLQAGGCQQFFFKYCSTFDSTDQGNIGAVAEALLNTLGSDFSIACPAFPANKRAVFKGYLFAGDVLLNESGMQNHPLTPMTDPNLVRVLDRQTVGDVALVPFDVVQNGVDTTRQAFDNLRARGTRMAIVDAVDDADLHTIGAACADMKLITGGSGIAIGLGENFRRQGVLKDDLQADALPKVDGYSAVLSGSCSVATQGQVAHMKANHPTFQIDPRKLMAGEDVAAEALAWALPKLPDGPVLIYSTAPPEQVSEIQRDAGALGAGDMVEAVMGKIAAGLVAAGVGKLVIAGGETSGAAVSALGVEALRIGPEIDPGVPWTTALNGPSLALALKSGNFGTPDFFTKALDMLA